jgi:hypothetical protein
VPLRLKPDDWGISVPIDVGTEKKRVVGQQSLRVHVSISWAQYDAHIYTNDGNILSRILSRGSSQRTATEVQQELFALKGEPVSQRVERQSGEEQGHSRNRTRMRCDNGNWTTIPSQSGPRLPQTHENWLFFTLR